MKPLHYVLLFAFFLLLFSMHFTSSTDLSQDLGRHIKIGEIILSSHSIPDSNLFSYTNSTFPFINHHWLSEVVFFLFARYVTLSSLVILKIMLILGSIAILLYVGYRKSYPFITIITAIIFSPLLLERSTIRPELFGYFLFSYILAAFFTYPNNKKILYGIPFAILLWINFHISFIFGIGIIGLLGIKILWHYSKETATERKKIIPDLYIIAGSLLITVINPHGVFGLLYPLNIFTNYGYTIVENQNIFFLNNLMMNPQIRYLFFLFPLIVISLIILCLKKKFLEAILLGVFFAAELMQIRHMPFFTLAAIPTVSMALDSIVHKIKVPRNVMTLLFVFSSVFCVGISMIFFQNIFFNTFDVQKKSELKVIDDYKNSSEFILHNDLPKNIFNNFDIGGYAIYKLYPQYSVFVDNRPEAYPRSFLQDIYIKLQTDPKLRDQIFKKYNIQTIYFAHTDQTYWADAFIRSMVQEKSWKLIYLDYASFIMTKDTNYKDIRQDNDYFAAKIRNEDNYINLIKLSHALNIFEKYDLADQAFLKAADINPSSCAINKNLYNQYLNSPRFAKAIDLKKNTWYCY